MWIRNFKKIIGVVAAMCVLLPLASCGHDEPDTPPGSSDPEKPSPAAHAGRTVLIYAVGSNSLSRNLVSDSNEMLAAAPSIAGLGKDVNVLMYKIDYDYAPALYELTCSAGAVSGEWRKVRDYDRLPFSTDPVRISEVFNDARELFPADKYGLVMWSHALGWRPSFTGHTNPYKRSFGEDKDETIYIDGVAVKWSDRCDLIELADAIPDRMFDFIWWDCCYMGGIEVAYQMRRKCEVMVASPAEVPGDGMPYDLTLPLLARIRPSYEDAARAYYTTYDRTWACAIAVMYMNRIEELADATVSVYEAGERPTRSRLINYARGTAGPFYDFGQYTILHCPDDEMHKDLLSDFKDAYTNFAPLRLVTEVNFNYSPVWTPGVASGISCHYPGILEAQEEEYYTQLDWYNRVVKD